MRLAETFVLYHKDGTNLTAKNFYKNPGSKLADGLVTEDGRIILCQDTQRGIFYFADTQENLYLNDPSSQS